MRPWRSRTRVLSASAWAAPRSSREAAPPPSPGTGSGWSGSRVLGHDAGHLQREERVPARSLVDAQQGLTRKRGAQTVAQQAMQRAHAQRADRHPLQSLGRQRRLDVRRLGGVAQTSCEEDDERGGAEPSQGKHQGMRRRWIEPLNVVDRDHRRPLLAQSQQRVTYRNGERAAINRIARGLLPEQRNLERSTPRRREQGKTSSTTPSNRSPRPTCPRPRSASVGRATSTL